MRVIKEMENAEVVRRLKEGDEDIFSLLYHQSYRMVYYQVLRVLQNESDAQDVTQEVFLSIFRSIQKLNDPEALRSWIGGIAVHKALNYRRNKAARLDFSAEDDFLESVAEEDGIGVSPEEALCEADSSVILSELIDQLPETQRITMMLYYYDECAVAQIASITGCAEGTVKSRLNYARKNLEKLILQRENRDSIRLHSFNPVLLFLALLRQEERTLVSQEVIAAGYRSIAGTLGLSAGAAAAGGGSAGAATAGSAAAEAAAGSGTAGAAAGAAGKALGIKIAAGVLAGAVAVGGGGYLVSHRAGPAPQTQSEPPAIVETVPPETPPAEPQQGTLDAEQKAAMLAALDNAEDPLYARLIDMDGDGTEELLLFEKVDSIGFEFWPGYTCYRWEDGQLREYPLNEGTAFNAEKFGLYRERNSGNVYVYYHSGMDVASDFFVSLSESVHLRRNIDPDSPPSWSVYFNNDWESEVEISEETYQAYFDRFEVIEPMEMENVWAWYSYWDTGGERPKLPAFSATVDEVRQELQNN